MIVDRYYYQQLNAQEQMIYRAFYDGVKSFRDFIPLPIHGSMSEEQFRRIFLL